MVALPSWRHRTFLSQGAQILSRNVVTTDSSLGLGCDPRGQNSQWGVGTPSPIYSHKRPGTPCSVPSIKVIPPISGGSSCSSQNRQYHCCGLHKQTRGSAIPSLTHTGTQTDYVEQCASPVTESYSCTGSTESGCRFIFQGEPSIRSVEAPPRGSQSGLDALWHASKSLCINGEYSVFTVLFREGSGCNDGCGRIGTRVVTHPPVCIPPTSPDFPHPSQDAGEGSISHTNSPTLAREIVVSGDHSTTMRSFVAPPCVATYCARREGRFSILNQNGWRSGPGP